MTSYSVLLGGSGRFVNSFDSHPASPKSLGCFSVHTFFTMEGSGSEIAKLSVPTLKAFLKAHCQSVSGNKQERVVPAIGGQKQHFLHILMIFWSAKKQCKDIFFHTPSPSPVILANATVVAFVLLCNYRFNFYCYLQREAMPNQKSELQLQPMTTSCMKDYEGHSLVQTSFAEVPNR